MEESRQPSTTSNPPSVENAYKRKCLALKKRLNEIEEENEMMRLRNRRGWQYIQKMRLESCILLERLAKVTGMTEEAQAGVNPELRARASAMMTNVAAVTGGEAGKNGAAGVPQSLEDETEGSSDEQPPTPQERPLRVKRSRKSNLPNDANLEDEAANNDTNNDSNSKEKEKEKDAKDKDATESGAAADGDNGNGDSSSSLPRLAPAPSQDEMTSSFRIQPGSNGSSNDKEGASDRGSHNPESAEQRGDGAEDETTPMDMDAKEELKEEREG
ncbi:hypothetical protein AAWM_01538 [Aspergillus awamori]|uniref:INO80 complex subunit F domain-containing protein n=3 Tax=Aspergillus TaxID=5052 RepID=A0A3F3PXX4_9EURO|nr:hypothetical protein BDQ94DRAFT_146547 [Aspergillus welwitschiae]RDK41822.1 hypothetical protein M752DRAFT_336222 [Aspergillus phoenicis ATCC 13157]GCB18653.1 hypothetical protein AAWM_01538 [Aspergillus awamori]GKZ62531.1 hypothetical protein AnigIFM49718_009950 [Aspergillus niger]RDH31735.1 hypothetical protein BDQ94DRAFT_146547 [Aspergillus welwitschiae]GKZ70066.1 hypothetical protein AnigIFM50267_005316 [Aspergillus niger]